MKYVILALVSGFLIAGGFWLGKNKNLNLVVVDTNKIIHQTAESLARKNLKPEQVQIQITKFKDDLQKSLRDYALLNKIIGKIFFFYIFKCKYIKYGYIIISFYFSIIFK